jgi:hypothetical protein
MRDKLIVLTLLLILIAVQGKTETKPDFATVDRLTYQYYQEQKWDSVILIGKQALKLNIDYYYLRVRMGIAYFEKQEYFPAVVHLQKARQFNSGDPFVTDYLCRAYSNTNRIDEANILKKKYPELEGDTSHKQGESLDFLHLEGGYILSSDKSPGNLNTLAGRDSIYGEQDLYDNTFYFNLALKLKISNRVSLVIAYNYLDFAKTKYIQYSAPRGHLNNDSFHYHVKQQEVHLGATVTLPDEFRILPAVHWIHCAYPVINTKVNPNNSYTFISKDTSFNNWVASLLLTKDLGYFTLGLSGSWSNLNNMTQEQLGVLLTYYPLGNLNFYGTTAVTGFFQDNENRLLVSQVLGAKATRWLWLEGNFYYGDYTNANIFNGSVVYNNTGLMDYGAGGNVIFVLNRHVSLSLIYQYFRKESQQSFYVKTNTPGGNKPGKKLQTKNNPYNTNSLIGGITWKL